MKVAVLILAVLSLLGCADPKLPTPPKEGPCSPFFYPEILVFGPSCVPGYEYIEDWSDGENDFLVCRGLTPACKIERRDEVAINDYLGTGEAKKVLARPIAAESGCFRRTEDIKESLDME